MARRLGEAASAYHLERTGHAPKGATVMLGKDTLVVTLQGALSPAERALASKPAGAAKVQDFHRQLFATSSEKIREKILEITGVRVNEAAAEVETASGTVVHTFTSGTMVQVYLLAEPLPESSWSGAPDPKGTPT